MARILKIAVLLFITGSAFAIPVYFIYKGGFKHAQVPGHQSSIPTEEFTRLKARASAIRRYVHTRHYNSKICFLADFKMPSGVKRFFVYDLQKDSVLLSGIVAHGSCDNGFQVNARFSNKINSGCSCTGKFSIGKKYHGRFGLAYKLYGLDSSNSNAYERNIVLHSYECVPGKEIYPLPVCNSRGCPMVSAGFLEKLMLYIASNIQPVLIEIFN
ncbi:MAG: murein L,D-transpeptidase catalytic domain-containing protein [Ginsengibacter sp.]